MAIGRVSGSMLVSNLDRQGTDLQFTTASKPLVYMNFSQFMTGINTNVATQTLTINGNLSTSNVLITDYTIGSKVASETLYISSPINLGDIGNVKITGGLANYIMYTDGAGNLSFGNLDALSGVEGFSADYIQLGSNAVGSFSNALTFTSATKVTDAIASLNQLLGNITDAAGTTIHVASATVNGIDVYANLSATSANVANLQSVTTALDANLGTATTNITTLFSNAATQTTLINTINANVGAANTAIATLQSQVYSNANAASYLTVFNGDVNAGNIGMSGNLRVDYISSNAAAIVTFSGSTAIKLPVGNTVARPAGAPGEIRYNTDTSNVEYYNGIGWIPVTNTVTDQQITGDGTNVTYTLDQTATNVGVLVSINGTMQAPGTAYSVSGNQITFAEIPLTTDVIDVRFLGGISTLNNTLSDDLTVSGNITLSGILSAPQTTKASNAIGITGQICWDANYIYVCTATNTWKRSPLTGGY